MDRSDRLHPAVSRGAKGGALFPQEALVYRWNEARVFPLAMTLVDEDACRRTRKGRGLEPNSLHLSFPCVLYRVS